jgi:DNA polymerase-3 subunit delta'
MNDIAVHPSTRSAIERYLSSPGQVLAIIGGEDSGKLGVATQIAGGLLSIDKAKVLNHPSVLHISRDDDKQEISIDSIRGLVSRLRVKAPGEGKIKRVALIENAHQLSREAQNALLKTLEQPNSDTVFLLTLKSAGGVLPTVISRAGKLVVHPIPLDQALSHYSSLPEAEVSSAWNISEGSASLMHKLLTDQETTELKASIEDAKSFISQDEYHRLIKIDELSKDRNQANLFLEALSKVLRAVHHSQIRKENRKAADKLLHSRKSVIHAQRAIAANASTKLVLLNLVTALEV